MRDVSGVLDKVIDKLGDVCSTWDTAGWEDRDDFTANVRRGLQAGPSAGSPCVIAKGLSSSMADRLVSELQGTTLESEDGLQVTKQGSDRVVLFLHGGAVDTSNPRVWCRRGAWASLEGRIGQVTMDPDSDSEVKLLWANGETSRESGACFSL